MHCRDMKKWDISDHRNYEHYWTNSWNETWKKIQILIGKRKFMAHKAQWKVPNL